MKLFDIWVDKSSTSTPGQKILIEKGVNAPSFRDACTLIFGDHIWFDSVNLTFRGEPLVGKCRLELESRAEKEPLQLAALYH